MCCTLVLIAPASYPPAGPFDPAYPVRSARVSVSGFLSAPLTGIQLPLTFPLSSPNWDGTNSLDSHLLSGYAVFVFDSVG